MFQHTHYVRTPWSTDFREKLIFAQLIKKFPAFYGTRWIITVFTEDSKSDDLDEMP
jgi:hypothetical protein